MDMDMNMNYGQNQNQHTSYASLHKFILRFIKLKKKQVNIAYIYHLSRDQKARRPCRRPNAPRLEQHLEQLISYTAK